MRSSIVLLVAILQPSFLRLQVILSGVLRGHHRRLVTLPAPDLNIGRGVRQGLQTLRSRLTDAKKRVKAYPQVVCYLFLLIYFKS